MDPQRRALATLVRFWRRLSIKNPPIPITLSFVSSLTDRDTRKPPLRRLDNYVPVHSLRNHLPASSTAGSARDAAPLVFRPSWSPPLPPPCCEYLDGPSQSPRSNVLTVFHTATRPSRVLIIPQTTTTSLRKSQSTMYNSTGPSASGRYAHPPRPSSRPRDPKIAILTTPIGLVPLDAKRRPGDGNPELRHARSCVLWQVTALDHHRRHSLLQQVQDSKGRSSSPPAKVCAVSLTTV